MSERWESAGERVYSLGPGDRFRYPTGSATWIIETIDVSRHRDSGRVVGRNEATGIRKGNPVPFAEMLLVPVDGAVCPTCGAQRG